MFPRPVPGQPAPLLRPAGSMSPFTGVASAWVFFPKGGNFIFLKWGETVLAEPLRLHNLYSPTAGSASGGQRRRASCPRAECPRGFLPRVCCEGAPSSAQTPRPAVPRQQWAKQKPEQTLKSLEQPVRETKDKTNAQGK